MATKSHVLKLVPDAIGLHTYEVLVSARSNITAMTVDIPGMMLYFATASPAGVHGLSVSTGSIFAVSLQNPATPYDSLPHLHSRLHLLHLNVFSRICNALTFESLDLGSSFLVRMYIFELIGQVRVSKSSGQGQGHKSKDWCLERLVVLVPVQIVSLICEEIIEK